MQVTTRTRLNAVFLMSLMLHSLTQRSLINKTTIKRWFHDTDIAYMAWTDYTESTLEFGYHVVIGYPNHKKMLVRDAIIRVSLSEKQRKFMSDQIKSGLFLERSLATSQHLTKSWEGCRSFSRSTINRCCHKGTYRRFTTMCKLLITCLSRQLQATRLKGAARV